MKLPDRILIALVSMMLSAVFGICAACMMAGVKP